LGLTPSGEGEPVTPQLPPQISRSCKRHHRDGVPIFVPSHRPPGPSVVHYSLVIYVTDVIASAMAQAKATAGERNVLVHDAYTAKSALTAGVLDELTCCWGGSRHPSSDRYCGSDPYPIPHRLLTLPCPADVDYTRKCRSVTVIRVSADMAAEVARYTARTIPDHPLPCHPCADPGHGSVQPSRSREPLAPPP